MVKFLRFKDNVAVLERAKNLRGTYIFLNKDYPEAVCQKRKNLIPAMKAARACGDIAYTRYDRLIALAICSLRNKVNEINNIHILAISETHLDN